MKPCLNRTCDPSVANNNTSGTDIERERIVRRRIENFLNKFFSQISHKKAKTWYLRAYSCVRSCRFEKAVLSNFRFVVQVKIKLNCICVSDKRMGGEFSCSSFSIREINVDKLFWLQRTPFTRVKNLRKELFHSPSHALRRNNRYVSRAVQICHLIAFSLVPRKSANWSVCLISLKNTSIPQREQ